MGIILCESRTASHPLFLDELGVHLYTFEELCYVISEYPLLFMDDFVNEPLLEFIDTELGRQHLTDDIRKYRNEGATDDDTLCLILKDCDSYSNSEVLHYQGKLKAFRKLAPPEYLKRKADALFGLKRYGKAVTIYEKILAMTEENGSDAFRGAVYNNEGSAYANLFLLDHAYRAYDKAYGCLKDREILKRIYFLSLMEPILEMKERYQSMVEEDAGVDWDQEFEKVRMEVKQCGEITETDAFFERDPIKRKKLITEKIEKWKQDYRNML